MLFDIQLVDYITKVVVTWRETFETLKNEREENSFFPFFALKAKRNKIKTNVYDIILVNNSQKRLKDEAVNCRIGWS